MKTLYNTVKFDLSNVFFCFHPSRTLSSTPATSHSNPVLFRCWLQPSSLPCHAAAQSAPTRRAARSAPTRLYAQPLVPLRVHAGAGQRAIVLGGSWAQANAPGRSVWDPHGTLAPHLQGRHLPSLGLCEPIYCSFAKMLSTTSCC